MNIEELKQKWGGSFSQVGDWATNPQINNQAQMAESDLYHARLFYDLASPIPLTREVFLNIEESPLGRMLKISENIDVLRYGERFFVLAYTGQGNDVRQKEIKYLHQLQQLYRFFRGKELTYTPSENRVSNGVSKG